MSTFNEIEITTPYGDTDNVLELNIDTNSDAYVLQNVIKLPSTYTFSIWYRTEIDSQITFNVLGESEIVDSTTVWNKFVKTVTVETLDETSIYIMPSVGVTSYFYEGYLVEGITDTSWLPAPEDIEGEIGSVRSELIQTADSILARVSASDGRISSLETNLDGVTSEIANAKGSSATLQARLEGIDASVVNAETNAKSYASQKADEISLSVGKTYATIDNVTGIDSRLSDAEATLTIQAGQIATKVGENGVISAINQTSEEVKIQANRITLEGATIADEFTATNLHITGNSTFVGSISATELELVDANAFFHFSGNAPSSIFEPYIAIGYDSTDSDSSIESYFHADQYSVGLYSELLSVRQGKVVVSNNEIMASIINQPDESLRCYILLKNNDFTFYSYDGTNTTNISLVGLNTKVDTISKDYVVEEGSTSGWTNGEWYYRKWASGIIEGWRCMKIETASGWAACGNVYYLDSYSGYPCDGMFESILNVTITPYHSSGHVMGVSQKSWYATSSQTGNKNITFTMYNYTNTSLSNVYVNIYMVGKWK